MKTINIENILAALIDQEGELFLGDEYMRKSYEGKVIAIEPDYLRDGLKMTLMDESEVEYDDNDNE